MGPAKPFLKWAGGKRQLLPVLLPIIGNAYVHRYYEPFLGGGALFFALSGLQTQAFLSDVNPRLVRAYRGVRDSVEDVLHLLRSFPHDRAFFLKVRAWNVDQMADTEVAAWLIYLNRTCFNGLYRVNKQGGFNVPFGDYKNPKICDEEGLRAASSALERAVIDSRAQDFRQAVRSAGRGDLVYFDPPYVPVSATSNFTGYTEGGFGDAEQIALRDLARDLKREGVRVILSNSSSPRVHELYEGFTITTVDARRNVNSKGAARGPVKEVIIT